MNNKEISLVLGSGGARGMAHVGVIRTLVKRGYTIKSISGSSIGALVGGAYAKGVLEPLADWICDLNEGQILDLFDFSLTGKGVMVGDKIYQKLTELGLHGTIQDLPIPFSCVSVDMKSKNEVVFQHGDLSTAIRASAAIPPYFNPVIYGDMELLDGGISNPLPIAYLKRSPNDMVMAIDLNSTTPYQAPEEMLLETTQKHSDYRHMLFMIARNILEYVPEGWFSAKKQDNEELYSTAFDIMQDKITRFILEKYQPDIHLELSRDACEVFEFQKAREMIEVGSRLTNAALDKYENTIQLPESRWARIANYLRGNSDVA